MSIIEDLEEQRKRRQEAAEAKKKELDAWHNSAQLVIGRKGQILSNVANAKLAFSNDEHWKGRLTYDEFSGIELLDGRPITDHDVIEAQIWAQIAGLNSLAFNATSDAMTAICRSNAFHQVRTALAEIEWDGVERLSEFLSTYFGANPSPFSATVGRMAMISMVARVMRPGCKVDSIMILEGDQGIGKSSACRILAGSDELFSDSLPVDLTSKDAMSHLAGKWVVELAELSSMKRSESEYIKSYLSRVEDKYRPAYGRKQVAVPRQCIFIGTTNAHSYLRDETGGRRFWPVRCGDIDLDGLARDRDQLVAEAVFALNAGEKWWPDREFELEHMVPLQESRYDQDVWSEAVADFTTTRDRVTVKQILAEALAFQEKEMRSLEARRITSILQRLGWIQWRSNGIRYWVRQ